MSRANGVLNVQAVNRALRAAGVNASAQTDGVGGEVFVYYRVAGYSAVKDALYAFLTGDDTGGARIVVTGYRPGAIDEGVHEAVLGAAQWIRRGEREQAETCLRAALARLGDA